MSDCKQSWDDPKFDPVARKDDHEKKHGRDSQERKPREECPECGEEIYLKWGPIRTNPYWSHNRAIDTPGAPGACCWQPRIQYPESEEHIKGKQIACDLLNRGLLKIETRCSECGAHEIAGMPRLVYCTEIADDRLGACRWDVAGLNASKEVLVGVEIKHLHETDGRLERSHVWWAELSASDLLWHDDVEDDEGPVTVKNRRTGQICFVSGDCKTRVAEKLRTEREEAERKRVEQERQIKEREEKIQKRLDWARRWGYIDKDSRFTDLVQLTDMVKGEIEKFPLCIRCGEDKDHDFWTPFCIDCRHEVTEYDRKTKLEHFGRAAGIFDGKSWKPTPPDWRSVLRKSKECEEFWERIFRVVKICAMCQRRRGYAAFPYCETCYKSVKDAPKKDTVFVQIVQPPPVKKMRHSDQKAEDNSNRVHQDSNQVAPTLDPMSLFMGNREYGPLLGITPTRRYLRAKRLECPMSKEIVDFFEKAIEEDNKTKK